MCRILSALENSVVCVNGIIAYCLQYRKNVEYVYSPLLQSGMDRPVLVYADFPSTSANILVKCLLSCAE